MGLAAKVQKAKAQQVRRFLAAHGLLDDSRIAAVEGNWTYLPVSSSARKVVPELVVTRSLNSKKSPGKLSHFLKGLSRAQQDEVRRSYDVVGSIIILELDAGLVRHEKRIAEYLLATHPSVKTVVRKMGGRKGTYRLQRCKHVAGVRTTRTVHTESGAKLFVDVARAYFSPRLSNERLRIARQVKPGESVLVMFSGVGPYPFVIARVAKPARVVGVELNPAGHRLAEQSLGLNKAPMVSFRLGDAKKIVPTLGTFDRVIMPLPKQGKSFLGVAMQALRPGGLLHYYEFSPAEQIPRASESVVEAYAAKRGRKARVLRVVRCGQHAPRVFRVCADVRVD